MSGRRDLGRIFAIPQRKVAASVRYWSSVIREPDDDGVVVNPGPFQTLRHVANHVVHGGDHAEVCPPVRVLHLSVHVLVLLRDLQRTVH